MGRGRVGQALAFALGPTALDPVLVGGRAWEPGTLTDAAAIVLAVPDAAIADCAERIAASAPGAGAVLHCAGARDADELAVCRQAGFSIGVMHPLASFPEPPHRTDLAGVSFTIAGDAAATRAAETIARAIGAIPLVANVQGPAYHALAALVANGTAALVHAAAPALTELGVTRQQAELALAALLRTVADNVRTVGVPRALTGPIMRGDALTVTAHCDALRRDAPLAAEAYRAVAPLIVRCAEDCGLPGEQARAIERAIASNTDEERQ